MKEQPRDMLYYTHKLSGAGSSSLTDAHASLSDPELAESEGLAALDDSASGDIPCPYSWYI